MKYISEIIGDEYKMWRRGQDIFITAPTGSGKTTFVLEQLLSFAVYNKQKILYLVNRKILKKQLKEKITNNIRPNLRRDNMDFYIPSDVIEIETYQTIERKIQDKIDMSYYTKFDYIIADEAHYFYHDATYNTSTFLSYHWIMSRDGMPFAPIFIFISATMDKVKDRIVRNVGKNEIFRNKEEKENHLSHRKIREYHYEADYSYIDLHVFDNKDEIIKIILSKRKEKWLVFVLSIDQGRLLERQLLDNKMDAVFIDARYDKNIDSMTAVEQVATEKKISNRVLIATSVLDNGVSIEDENLRNLIVMADTKEDFMQMIGRKRVQNQEKIKLYICKRSQNHFEQRLNTYVLPLLNFIEEYEKLDKNINGSLESNAFDRLLRRVLQNQKTYEYVKGTCYLEHGYLYMNQFAVEQIDYLNDYYQKLIQRFKSEGELAFLNQQAEWIGISNIEENYESYVVDKQAECRNQIVEALNPVLEKELTTENSKGLKKNIKESLIYLLEIEHLEEDMVTEVDSIKKTDRPLSYKVFNNIMCALGIEFRMKENRGAPYIIQRADQPDLPE